MWIAKVFFLLLLLFATGPLLRLFFSLSSYFPPLAWRCRDLLPRLPGLMGSRRIGGYTKCTFRRALMAPMPVERCSVLYEPGARRHALESEGLGGVKAALLCKGIVYTAPVVVYKHLRGCSEWREAVLMAHSLLAAFVPARRYQVPWSPGSDRPDSAIAPRG